MEPGAGVGLPRVQLEELRSQFNRAGQSVRVLAILSPSCPACQHGQGVIRSAFEKFRSERLKGFVIWLPILSSDSAPLATRQAEEFDDRRVVQRWDADRRIGETFAGRLNLRGTAWDVYLLYAPGVKWEGDTPPAPTFWMHQLTRQTGADSRLCLNPGRFLREVGRLLEKAG
ncbi:MAG: hypothetical protein ACRD1P_08980 [Thermoanaerobaculia bacterium]